jgi:hypothetical protein
MTAQMKLKRVQAASLIGPRSYFTDLDPDDPTYIQTEVLHKLKLQLLTKNTVVIAASSLFHKIGYEFISSDLGLVRALEEGILLPALRGEFGTLPDFFEQHKWGYTDDAQRFFCEHVTTCLPWDLQENSTWFKEALYRHLHDPNSVLRRQLGISEIQAMELVLIMEERIATQAPHERFLRRDYVKDAGAIYGPEVEAFLSNYATLLYRISGSRVVNSEPHFPQGNLTKVGVTEKDRLVSDEAIFWDIYVEAVVSLLNSAIRLTPERLSRLTFSDILRLRESLLDANFSTAYDNVIGKAKADVNTMDAEHLVLRQEELLEAARMLRVQFANRVSKEVNMLDTGVRENALWQLANTLSMVAPFPVSAIIGTVTSFQTIPEITVPLSKSLAEAMKRRLGWAGEFVNTRIGWSKKQKRSLLSAYKQIVSFGILE